MSNGMVTHKPANEFAGAEIRIGLLERLPLWQLDIVELTGHNLEARGREEVNRLLCARWRLLHIYTLKYEEDGVWRERQWEFSESSEMGNNGIATRAGRL